jgi:transposase
VLAATGGYEAPVAAEVCLAGLPVAVVKARQGRDVATASGHVAKTDRLDAPVLAHCAAAVRRTAPHCAPRHDRCPMRKRRNWRRWWSGGASWWRCTRPSRRGWG